MYPFVRLFAETVRHRGAAPLPVTGEHVSHHMCWPWDIDPWGELNNGRTLTLYDLGRFVLFRRLGVIEVFRAKRWSGTVAGLSIRYRRRVRMFDRYTLRSRFIGFDGRFFYAEQGMWRNGECTSHGLLRLAITSAEGIVPPAEVAEALGAAPESPPLPDWVTAWIAAEGTRPWPPMQAGPVDGPFDGPDDGPGYGPEGGPADGSGPLGDRADQGAPVEAAARAG